MLPLCLHSAPSFVHFLPPQNRLQTLNPSLAHSPISCRFLRNQETRYPRTLTFYPLCSPHSVEIPASAPILIEEIIERDWSFLEHDAINSDEERRRKTQRTISASGVREGSRVLVCMWSEWFVDRLVESAPAYELLLVIHESLFALAMTKEKYDGVRCWQGEIADLPQKFSRFDAVFVCYFPGMGLPLHQLLSSVASRCSPGARLLISFDQGKQVIEGAHRQQYPEMVKSLLPDRAVLGSVWETVGAPVRFKRTGFLREKSVWEGFRGLRRERPARKGAKPAKIELDSRAPSAVLNDAYLSPRRRVAGTVCQTEP